MPTSVLITGANGFLARAVAAVAPPDWRLLGLLRPGSAATEGRWHAVHERLETLQEAGSVDAVLHLAARIPADMRRFEPELIAANVMLPAQLLQRFPDARHVLASSVAVYGVPATLPLAADTPPSPATPYGWSKLAAEHVLRMAPRHAILRLSSIIGRGMRPGSFIPAAVAAAKGGRIGVHGDGSRVQDYIDVRDAARMCVAAVVREDNFATLAVSGKAHSNAEVARMLAALCGADVVFSGTDASPSHAYTLDNAVDLGPCLVPLHETLADMVAG